MKGKYLLKTTISEYFCDELPIPRTITADGVPITLSAIVVHTYTKQEQEFSIVFTPPYIVEEYRE